MAIKFEKIRPGMRLMDIHSETLGNTTRRRLGRWFVDIVSVDPETETAVVCWNSNAPKTYSKRQLERLYTKEPKAYRSQQKSRI